jgi:hypothetical protein
MAITPAVIAAIVQDRGTAFVDPRLKSSIQKLNAYDSPVCLQNPTTLACESFNYRKTQISSTINFEVDCQLRQYGSVSISGIWYPGVTAGEATLLINTLRDRLLADPFFAAGP